jgi:hypothetical protein
MEAFEGRCSQRGQVGPDLPSRPFQTGQTRKARALLVSGRLACFRFRLCNQLSTFPLLFEFENTVELRGP